MNRKQRRFEQRKHARERRGTERVSRTGSTPTSRGTFPATTRLSFFNRPDLGRLRLVLGVGIGVVLIIGIIGFVSWRTMVGAPAPQYDRSEDLPGQYFEHMGIRHLQAGQVFTEYNSNPPTSGPMDPRATEFKIYNDPLPKETLVHTMEHGAVIIWHNCTDCQETIDQLKDLARNALRNRRNVAMVPYADMEPGTVALTAWTRLDKFPVSDLTSERVERFIQAHDSRYKE